MTTDYPSKVKSEDESIEQELNEDTDPEGGPEADDEFGPTMIRA